MKNNYVALAFLCIIPISCDAGYTFRISYDESSPEQAVTGSSLKIEFEEGKRECHLGGASSESFSCPTSSESTHRLSYSVSAYKIETPKTVRFEYKVNDTKGEITTTSFPVEIKVNNFYFESHPDTPYILMLTINEGEFKPEPTDLPPLELLPLVTLEEEEEEEERVDPVDGGQ